MKARALALPLSVGVAVLVVLPSVMTLALAFTHYDGLRAPEWAGLANFRRLIADPIFRTALWNSLVFVAIAVPLRVLAALGLALLYARRRRGTSVGRVAAYIPTVVPDIAYGLLWLWVFNPVFGPLAAVARALGFDAAGLLLSPWGARSAIVVMTLFQIGEGFVVALAVRQSLPAELYELAEIDGARPLWTFRRVTLPLMAPALVLLAARDVAFSFQASFVPALVVTDGGPFYATTFLPLHTYRNAFEFFRFGYASAMTVTMQLVTMVTIGVQVVAARRWMGAARQT